MMEEAGLTDQTIAATDVSGGAEVVEDHREHRQRRRRGEQRSPALAGPEKSVRPEHHRQDGVRRPVAGDQSEQQPGRERPRHRTRRGQDQQRADHQDFGHPLLPQRLAADHPRGCAERIRDREQQRGSCRRPPSQ
jgi:hypothetical protein